MSSTPSLTSLKSLVKNSSHQQHHLLSTLTSTVRKRRLSLGRAQFSKREREQLQLVVANSWHQLHFLSPLWGLELAAAEDVQRMCRALASAVNTQCHQLGADITITPRVLASLTESSLAVAGTATPTLLLSLNRNGESTTCAELLLVSDPRSYRFLPVGGAQEPCTWFPVVLTRGHHATCAAFVEQMRLIYGATPGDFMFTQEQMKWMSSMWANGRDTQGARLSPDAHLTYTWQTPSWSNFQAPLTMNCKFQAEEIADIWDKVHGDSPYLHLSEMIAFHDCLASVLKNDMHLMLHQFLITSFESPAVKISSSGSVVFHSTDIVPRVLSHFKQFAAEFFGY